MKKCIVKSGKCTYGKTTVVETSKGSVKVRFCEYCEDSDVNVNADAGK